MSFSVPLVLLVSGYRFSLPNGQPHHSTFHPRFFSPCQFHFLSCISCTPPLNYSLPKSRQDIVSLSIPLAMAIYNSKSAQFFVFFFFFPSHDFGLTVSDGEKQSAMPIFIFFSLCSNLTVLSILPRESLTNL